MRLQTKTTLFYSISTLLVVLTIIIVSLFSFRQFSINSAKQSSQTVAEMVRLSLTEAMINGVIDKRENYLHRLTQIEGLLNIRVIRSDHVRKQFGEGMETERIKNKMESEVLETGKAVLNRLCRFHQWFK